MFANVDFTYSNLLLWGGFWLVALFITAAFFSVVVHKVLDSKSPGKAWLLAVPAALLTLGLAVGGIFYHFNSVYGFVTGEGASYRFTTVLLLILHAVLALITFGLTISALRFFLIPSLRRGKKSKKALPKATVVKTPALNKPVAKTDEEFDDDIEAELKAMGF